MICPACDSQLVEKDFDGVHIDVCENGCGGLWFDWMELKKFDEPHEATGTALLEIVSNATVVPDMEKKHNCPKCENIVLYRHFFSVKRHTEVDECPKCGGFWLDAGELAELRSLYKTEEERKNAAAETFDNMFGNQLEELREKSEADREKARKIAKMFRFICPSAYIKGRQNWGAW